MSDQSKPVSELEQAAMALIGHAARMLPGDEEPNMDEVRATVIALALDPRGIIELRRAIMRVNDPDTVQLVKALIVSVGFSLELEAKGGHSATWVPPLHNTSIGGVASSAIALAAGTIAATTGLLLLVCFGGSWALTTFWRSRQAAKEGVLKRQSDLAKALAASIT